jgi:hypothetical protein
MSDSLDRPGKLSKLGAATARFFRSISQLISTASSGINTNQIAMSLVCLVFLLVVLIPTLITASLMYHQSFWKANPPNFSARMLLYMITGSGDDFSRLTAFITPFFALLAGLKSRSGEQSLFFALFVCLSLFGAVGSLLAKYYVLSVDGHEIFSKPDWVGEAELAKWNGQAQTCFNSLFQTFLSFVSILLGLRAAGS